MGFKLKESQFRLDTRKKFFTMKLVKQRHRLPREVVDAPSPGTFKVRMEEQTDLVEDIPAYCRGLD